jgi:hypothetical protein
MATVPSVLDVDVLTRDEGDPVTPRLNVITSRRK